jgi:peptidyl-prolyl cis-trans isomerase B (cyclophilin B)
MMSGPLPPSQYPPAAMARPTNSLAVASLICAVFIPPLGVVFGHIALYQIKRSGDDGRGAAITALVVGYTLIVVLIGLVIFLVVMLYQFKDLFSLIGIFAFFSWLFPASS